MKGLNVTKVTVNEQQMLGEMIKNMKKRLVAFLISLVMIVGSIPSSEVFASELLLDGNLNEVIEEDSDVLLSGEFSDQMLLGNSTEESEALEMENSDDFDLESNAVSGENIEEGEQNVEYEDVAELSRYVTGIDYVANEVYALTEDADEATGIGAMLNAKLISHEYGVAKFRLSEGMTVLDAIILSHSEEWSYSAIYANYLRKQMLDIDIAEESDLIDEDNASGVDSDIDSNKSHIMDSILYYVNDMYVGDEKSSFYQKQHDVVGSKYAWVAGYRGAGVKVGVLSSGVNEVNDVKVVAHNNFTAEVAEDEIGDGTFGASVVGGKLDGSYGAGIAPDCSIYDFKVVDKYGDATDSSLIAAINYAVTAKIDIALIGVSGIQKSAAYELALNKAYNEGVLLISAVGSSGGSNATYPAGYDCVCAVAMTDANGAKIASSDSGSFVDFAAPGNFVSGSMKTSGYNYYSGTYAAGAVFAGEAAVILSAKNSIPELKGKTGVNLLEALTKYMKSNAKSAGNGMGAGVVDLKKVFAKKSISEAPSAPMIGNYSITGENSVVEIKLEQPDAVAILYTIDGSTPTYKDGTMGAKTVFYDGLIDIPVVELKSRTITVKAIAINKAGLCSKVATKKVSIKDSDIKSLGISIKGQPKIGAGMSAAFTVTVVPSVLKNKNYSWEVRKSGVSVSGFKFSKGKLSVPKDAVLGNYTLNVYFPSTSVSASAAFEVTSGQKVQFVKPDTSKYAPKKKVIEKVIESTTTFSALNDFVFTEGASRNDFYVTLAESNPGMAYLNSDNVLTISKAGNLSVTVTALDGYTKPATVTYCVYKKAATAEILRTDVADVYENNFNVAKGKSMALGLNVSPSDASGYTVEWIQSELMKRNGITVKNGVIKVGKKASIGNYSLSVKIINKDTTSFTRSISFEVLDKATSKISLVSNESTTKVFRCDNRFNSSLTKGSIKVKVDAPNNFYSVSTSNDLIRITNTPIPNSEGIMLISYEVDTDGVGTSNIIVTALDGSKKTLKTKINVLNPVSAVNVTSKGASSCLIAGKSMQLTAQAVDGYGKLGKIAFDWNFSISSGNLMPSDITLKNGKISVKKGKYGQIFVYAYSKDGSGAYGYIFLNVTSGFKTLELYVHEYDYEPIKKTLVTGKTYTDLSPDSERITNFIYYKVVPVNPSEPSEFWPRVYSTTSSVEVGSTMIHDKEFDVKKVDYAMGKLWVYSYTPGKVTTTVFTEDGSLKTSCKWEMRKVY